MWLFMCALLPLHLTLAKHLYIRLTANVAIYVIEWYDFALSHFISVNDWSVYYLLITQQAVEGNLHMYKSESMQTFL